MARSKKVVVQTSKDVKPLNAEEIRDLVSNKWLESEQEKFENDKRVLAWLIDGIKEAVYTSQFHPVGHNEIQVTLNNNIADRDTFDRMLTHANNALSELRLRIIRGKIIGGDMTTVTPGSLTCHVQVLS